MQDLTGEDEPPRQVWHFALLVLVGLTVVASLALSGRSPLLSSFNNVAPAGAPPAGVVPPIGEDWGTFIHRSDYRPAAAKLLGRMGEGQGVRLGWVVRQWSFLGLPLVGYRQGELAAFEENSGGYKLVGLTDEQRAAIDRAGAPWFPWWRVGWGWLAVAAVAGFAGAELRWQARRRAALGLI